MKYAPMGRTGVQVSKLAIGTATFGVAPAVGEAERVVAAALDLGVNYFDCANSYGNQARFDRPGVPPADQRVKSPEKILGRALKGRRNDVIISTKVREPVGTGVNDQGLSRLHIFNQVERSLKRLGTDHIDLYYAHHPDPNTPIEETMRTFDDLIRQGKIRYACLSTYQGWQIVEALWAADKIGMVPPPVNQMPYNLALRIVERDAAVYQRHGVSLTLFSPLAGGLFTGAVDENRTFAGGARWGGSGFSEQQIGYANQLKAISKESGHSMPELALAWLLSRPAVCSAVIGPENVAELQQNIGAADIELSPELLARVDEVGKPPAGPGMFG